MTTATYSLAEVAHQMRLYEEMKDPVRWLTKEIKVGRIPARRIGRSWRMTEQDIADALEECRNTAAEARRVTFETRPSSGLSRRSRQLRGMPLDDE
jgi:hypothetical protein